MSVLIVRVLDHDEPDRLVAARDGVGSLPALWRKRTGGQQMAVFQTVRLDHPHVSWRNGFAPLRRLLAIAPHAVMTGGRSLPPWAGLLKSSGIPVFAEDQAEWPAIGDEARWTRPVLDAKGLIEKARKASRITLLGEGVAVREGDGLTVGTDLMSAFAIPAPDVWICRRRVTQLQFPDRQGTVYTVPDEDTLLLGEPSIAVAGRTSDPEAISRALVRSSSVWPTVGLRGGQGSLVSVSEVWRCGDDVWSRPEIQLLLLCL